MNGEQFVDAEALEEYLHSLNEAGLDATVPILSSNGRVYLSYGEERSGGGEWMTCWLIDGDPYSNDIWDLGDYCNECGRPDYRASAMALDHRLVKYPVTLLHDPSGGSS